MPIIPFARQSKSAPGYSGERLKNLFLRQSDGYAAGVLIGRSGMLEQFAPNASPVRDAVALSGALYTVAGGNVFKIKNGAVTVVGSVLDDVNTQMAVSSTQIAIVAGGRYYVCDGTTTTGHTTGAITDPVGVAYMDGYFIVIGSSGGREDAITITEDGTTFDALEFAFAENAPDKLVGIIEDHNQLWMFGSTTTEVWYNSGAAAFPFARNPGALKERGATAGTMAKEDNSVFWVGEDLRAYRSGGDTPGVISTREVEDVIKAGTMGRAFIVDDRGHKFFVIRFTDRPALAYDLTTGLWCELSTGVGEMAFAATCSARVGSTFYVGTTGGKIATLDENTYQDLGGVLEAEAISQPVARAEYFTVNRVHMNIEAGDVNAQGNVMLQVSKDGRTWGGEKWRKLGALGEFFRRITWHGLGAARRFQFRIRITDPVQRDIYGVEYS